MEKPNLLREIAARTDGRLNILVCGPARSGKSTFITRYSELILLPTVTSDSDKERIISALPEMTSGAAIATTRILSIPDQPVEVAVDAESCISTQIIECVGIPIRGAEGYEDGAPRLISVPGLAERVPLKQAGVAALPPLAQNADAIVFVTSDGTTGDFHRPAFAKAEETGIPKVAELKKPAVIIINTTEPYAEATLDQAAKLENQYGLPALVLDCDRLTSEDVYLVLEQLLYEFPATSVDVEIPEWTTCLPETDPLKVSLQRFTGDAKARVSKMRDVESVVKQLTENESLQEVLVKGLDLSSGRVVISLTPREDLFYQALSRVASTTIEGKSDLVSLMKEMAVAKREFDKLRAALEEARESGYGMVPPTVDEMKFEEPELIKKGGQFGIKLRATAPSLHIIQANVEAEVTPMLGTERQSEELLKYLMDQFADDPQRIWNSNIFGKPIAELLREGIENKLHRMPENAQQKLQETLTRIVNEGSGGLICIII